jgi:hypothetical protein
MQHTHTHAYAYAYAYTPTSYITHIQRKYFEKVSPSFAVREDSTCVLKNGEEELTWNTSAGPCTAPAMGKDAQIR